MKPGVCGFSQLLGLISNLVTVLHELCQVEQSLRDLRDVLGGEGQLDAADELVLLVFTQLGPTRQEGGVEQVPVDHGAQQTHV